MDIGLGFSTAKNSVLAAQEATRLAKMNMKEEIDLAVAFSSTDISSTNLLNTIATSLGTEVPLIGLSGLAIISNQGISTHGLVLLLLKFPEGVHFNTAYTKDVNERSTLAGEEMGEKLLYGFQDIPRALAMIFSDGLIEAGSNFIYGLQERLGRSFPVTGASAPDSVFLKSHLYFNREVSTNGCAGILWGGKLNFSLGIKHGWKPLGKPHIVTKSNDNVVDEIDYKPAVKFYQEYFNCDFAKLRKDLNQISIFYPIGVYLEGEEEYLLRNILSIESNGTMRFQGNVPQGSQIRLMIGTKETCLAAAKQAAEEAKRNLFSNPRMEIKKEGLKKFALVFSSISRFMLLRRDANRESEIIQEVLGPDTSVIGLYTRGELAPLRAVSYRGEVYLHNQAISILIIGG